MRIISGAFKGRRLRTPAGRSLRPTSDRTREAIFNILYSSIETFGGCRVLDLFAGTGALGIEALSRGASSATFVEKEQQALIVLQHNVSTVATPDQYEIICAPVSGAISLLQKRGAQFDLIFMDPPYGKNLVHATLAALAQTTLVAGQGLIVCEHFSRDCLEEHYGQLYRWNTRRYGQTMVSFFKLADQGM